MGVVEVGFGGGDPISWPTGRQADLGVEGINVDRLWCCPGSPATLPAREVEAGIGWEWERRPVRVGPGLGFDEGGGGITPVLLES